jgi:probable phosphoglycerate mutase
MQITFIRHLPTEWNEKTWLQGRRDIELMPVSTFCQNKISSNRIKLEKLAPFDLVLASNLKRTQQTANYYGFEAKIEPLLEELDFGDFEAKPKEKLINKYRNKWLESPKEIILGEPIANLEKRIVTFLEKYHSYRNILVFGHGSWIRAVISYVQYGHINNMNKMTVENNECITILFEPTLNKGL